MDHVIRHEVEIAAAPEVVASALSLPQHIAGWWTREVSADGRRLRADWSVHGWQVELEIVEEPEHGRVLWHCLRSNLLDSAAWVGTVLSFELASTAHGTRLLFQHRDYPDAPCRSLCERGWGFFIGSLKRYVETGEGLPYPDMPDPGDAGLAEDGTPR